jgi:hypothetical protein
MTVELLPCLERPTEGDQADQRHDKDVDTADPGTVHAGMRNTVAAFVDNRNVHELLDFSGLLFGICTYLRASPSVTIN